MSVKIGVAGCGRMGLPMLLALRDAGFSAFGFDIRPQGEFGQSENLIVNDPDCFAEGLEILISVVRDIPETEEVLFGTQQFLARAPALKTVVICSTLSPRYVESLRERVPDRISLIDAPMSGASVAARERRLSFMLGGDSEKLAKLRPVFEAMGTHFHHMGGFGKGMSAKVLNNLLAASSTAMTRLVLDWAGKSGLDESALLSLINNSSGQNWFATGFENIEFARDGYEADNTIGILVKDVESALDAAPADSDVALPRAVQTAIRNLAPFAGKNNPQ